MAKILCALSGGVDSSVAAALMLEEGHEVVGAYMKNWINTDNLPGECPWEEDLEDAHAVAKALNIEFRVIDLIEQYRHRIVDYLLEGYRSGVTPNPDVFCNREMKFGVFLDYALEQGFEAVATGHYTRRRESPSGEASILRGADPNKDQSYFLALLDQSQAFRARFPVGEMLKPAVRELAQKHGLPTAKKKDSQGICFIGNIKMSDFLSHYVPDNPGEIVDIHGKKLGRHRGLHLYTLGQRKGHGVASPRGGMAYVVVGKNLEENLLILGWDEAQTHGLYATECTLSFLSSNGLEAFPAEFSALAQPRYRSPAEPVTVRQEEEGRWRLTFSKSQRALTPGQICALYDGGRLLGGGSVAEVFSAPSI